MNSDNSRRNVALNEFDSILQSAIHNDADKIGTHERSGRKKSIAEALVVATKIDDNHFAFEGKIVSVLHKNETGANNPKCFILCQSEEMFFFNTEQLFWDEKSCIEEDNMVVVLASKKEDVFDAIYIREASKGSINKAEAIDILRDNEKRYKVNKLVKYLSGISLPENNVREFTGKLINITDKCYFDFMINISNNSLLYCKATPETEAFLFMGVFEAGDEVVIRGKRCGKLIIVDRIMSVLEHKIQCALSDKNCFEKYCELSDNIKTEVRDQLGVEHDRKHRVNMDISPKELALKYEVCRNTYPDMTKNTLDFLIGTNGADKVRRGKSFERAKYLVGIHTHYYPENCSPEAIKTVLDSKFYGLEDVKQQIVELFETVQLKKGAKGMSILLVGKSGMGKTSIALAIAKARKKPYHLINCTRITSAVALTGAEQTFESAGLGAIGNAIVGMGTTDGTLIFDEIDKSSRSDDNRNGNPYSIYINVLDGSYEDSYLETPIDNSDTLILATANKLENIPEPVRSRFDVIIDLPEYKLEEKIYIANHVFVPKALDEYGVSPLSFSIESNALDYMINNYCYDFGVRDLEHNIRRIIKKYVSNRSNLKQHAFRVDCSFIDDCLRSLSMSNKEIIYKNILYFNQKDQLTVKETIYDSESQQDSIKSKGDISRDVVKWLSDFFKNTISTPYEFSADEFINDLDSTHSEMLRAKRALCRSISRHSRTKKGGNLLLVGPPGTGKTTIVQSACIASRLPYEKLPMNGVNNAEFIKGTSRSFGNADPGRLLSKIKHIGKYGVIHLDEIDKMSRTQSEVIASLLDLLDEKRFYSPYLDVTLDLSGVIFIATANDLKNVPPELVDRFEICEVSSYSKNEQRKIFVEHILPNAVKSSMVDSKIVFNNEAIDYLIDNYTSESGARNLTRHTENIIEDCINKYENKDHTVTIDDIIYTLGDGESRSFKIGF